MSRPVRIAVPYPGRPPEVRLIDARWAGLDEAGLRTRARAVTAGGGGAYESRSYRHPYCIVAWHCEPVGIDIERIQSFDPAFTSSISTPAELADPPPSARELDRYTSSLWCSKEALAKALGNPLAYDPRRLESPSRWPGGCSGPWRTAHLAVGLKHTAWLCWTDSGA